MFPCATTPYRVYHSKKPWQTTLRKDTSLIKYNVYKGPVMKTIYSLAASLLALASLVPSAAQAAPLGNTGTYTNIVWSVATSVPELARCNELKVDITGDLNNGTNYSVYGNLNCAASNTSYPVSGSASFLNNGTFTMNLFLSSGTVLQCFNLNGLSGTCRYVTTGTNAVLGTATLTFR